jgi:hypothetical protein
MLDWTYIGIGVFIGVPWVVEQVKDFVHRNDKEESSTDDCHCGHASVFHDSSGCRKIVTVPVKWDDYGDESKWEQRECECLRYAGPNSSYVPELDGLPEPKEITDARPSPDHH